MAAISTSAQTYTQQIYSMQSDIISALNRRHVLHTTQQ